MRDAIDYWQDRILGWERARYKSPWLAPFFWQIRRRLKLAVRFYSLIPESKKSVLELGCGSGLLLKRISCQRYLGVDAAPAAIENAPPLGGEVQFKCADAVEAVALSEDYLICVFLGLTDWLDKQELETLLLGLKSPWLIFSYTEEASVKPWNPYYLYKRYSERRGRGRKVKARVWKSQEIRLLLKTGGYHIEKESSGWINPGRLILARRAGA